MPNFNYFRFTKFLVPEIVMEYSSIVVFHVNGTIVLFSPGTSSVVAAQWIR